MALPLDRKDLRWLSDDLAKAACVLWASGQFCTADIASLLLVPENAVDRPPSGRTFAAGLCIRCATVP